MEIINVNGSDRQKKYPTKVNVRDKNEKNEVGGKITVIRDSPQKYRVKGISIFVPESESKTSIKISNQKLIDPILKILKKEWNELHWIKNYQKSTVSTHVELTTLEIERLKILLEEKIKF